MAQEEEIDLLLTDIVLPGGMSGADLARKARKLRPTLRVLFISGYTRDTIVSHGRLDPAVDLLQKPFTRAELAHAVRRVLEGEGSGYDSSVTWV